MSNPFDRVYEAGASASDVAAEAAGSRFTSNPSRLRHGRTSILSGREEMNAVKQSLLDAANTVESVAKNGGTVSASEAEALEKSSREFVRAANKTAFAEGKLLASIKGAFKSMFGKLGFDTSEIGANALKAGEVNETIIKAYKVKAGMLERIASKPFRIMANNPVVGLFVAGTAAIYGGSAYIKNRAERRTEREAQEAMMQAQTMAAAQQAPRSTYKNTVTQADMDAINARMAADGKAAPNFTANVEAQQQAQAPVTSVA